MHLAMASNQVFVWRELAIDGATYSASTTARVVTISSMGRVFPIHATAFSALSIQPVYFLVEEVLEVLLSQLRLLIFGLVDRNVPFAVVVESDEQLEVLVDLQIFE